MMMAQASRPVVLEEPLLIQWDEGWKKISEQGIERLYHIISGQSNESFTYGQSALLYATIYQMCVQKPPHCYTPQLYERFVSTIEDYLRRSVLAVVVKKTGVQLVEEVVRLWGQHRVVSSWLCKFFMYLDRYYTGRFNRPRLADVCLSKFETIVFNAVEAPVTAVVLDMLLQRRRQRPVDNTLLRSAIALYVGMEPVRVSVYKRAFEVPFLHSTVDFYRHQASEWLREDTCPEYLAHTEAAFVAERATQGQLLHPSTEQALVRALYDALLSPHHRIVLSKEGSGFPWLLGQRNARELALIFRLYAFLPDALPLLANDFRDCVVREGAALFRLLQDPQLSADVSPGSPAMQAAAASAIMTYLNTAPAATSWSFSASSSSSAAAAGAAAASISAAPGSSAAGEQYIEALVALHDDHLRVLATCFQSHGLFSRAFKAAFEQILLLKTPGTAAAFVAATTASSSSSASTAALAALTTAGSMSGTQSQTELLVAFIDSALRKASGHVGEAELEARLESAARVFAFVADKDLFHETYRKALAKRLLTFRAEAPLDAERAMVAKLKLRCGAQFTSKLEAMLHDMRNSAEHLPVFLRWLQSRGAQAPSFDVGIATLTNGSWPQYLQEAVVMPPALEACAQQFADFYAAHTSSRKLVWLHHMSIVTVLCRYAVPVEVITSGLQAAVLLLFNQYASLTVQQLLDHTKMAPDLLKLQLRSLVSGQFPILAKSPADGYGLSHSIKPNTSFRSPARRIRIPPALVRAQAAEVVQSAATVAVDRRHSLDAAIVRVMKSRKTVSHAALLAEVSQQLMALFRPDPAAIKARIEDLIARDYMDRDKDKPSVYHYLA